MYYLLFYKTADDYMEKRQAYRAEHLKLAQDAVKSGALIFGGAYANPADGAALVFKCDDIKTVEDFVKNDPYVKNGVVVDWNIREWTVVVGND